MKNILICYFIILFCSYSSFGQELPIGDVFDPNGINTELLYRKERKEVIGKPELLDSYTSGRLIFENSKIADGVQLNYDLINNQILLGQNNLDYVVPTNLIKEFQLQDRRFVKYSDEFYEVLYEGVKLTFLRLPDKQIIRKVATNTSYNDSNSTNDRIVEKETFYIVINGGLNEIELKRKSFKKLFGESLINNYIKKNKIKFTDINDVVSLIEKIEKNENIK